MPATALGAGEENDVLAQAADLADEAVVLPPLGQKITYLLTQVRGDAFILQGDGYTLHAGPKIPGQRSGPFQKPGRLLPGVRRA